MEELFDYRFEFFKPGKDFFLQEEITDILGFPNNFGCEIVIHSNNLRYNAEKRNFIYDSQEAPICVDFIKNGITLNFQLQLDKKDEDPIAVLGMSKDEFEKDFENNSNFLYNVALLVSSGLKPYFAWGDHSFKLDHLRHKLSFDGVGALAWVNLFSKEFLDKIGGIQAVLLDKSEINVQEAINTLKTLSVIDLQICPFPTGVASDSILDECKKRWPKVLL